MKDHNYIRELPLLPQEQVVQIFVPTEGLVRQLSSEGELLALTSRRVIAFTQEDGKGQALMAPLEEIAGVSVKTASRSSKTVYQGVSLILVGIMLYLVLGYASEQAVVAAFLGGAVAFLGILLISRYLAWEQGGLITFQAGTWELSFPYSSSKASSQVYQVAHRFFQLKLGVAVEDAEPQELSPLAPSYLHEVERVSWTRDVEADPRTFGPASPETERGPHPGQDYPSVHDSGESSHRPPP